MAPKPSSVGTPSAAVKLPSEPPPALPSSSVDARCPRRTAFAWLEQAHDAGGALERRAIEPAGDLERAPARCGVNARIAADASASARVMARASMARVPRRTTFGARAAADDADGERDAVRQVLRSSMARIWRASSRIALTPLPGSRPACAGHAARDHLELADALAAGLQRAARQRRLEHQHRLALRRFGFDQRARRPLPISSSVVHSIDDAAVVERAAIDARARRQRRQADAGLHVEHAGPVQPAAFALERHPLELADRPHRVEVAEQEDLPRAAAEAGAQVIAGGGRWHARHRAADRLEPRRQLGAAAIDRGRIVARRFDRDERFDELEQPIVIGEAVVETQAIASRFLGGLGS